MIFTAYLGELPEDVLLVAVHLNGEEYMLPFGNTSSYMITKVTYANNSQGYTLKVPFDHPVVVKKVNLPPLTPQNLVLLSDLSFCFVAD